MIRTRLCLLFVAAILPLAGCTDMTGSPSADATGSSAVSVTGEPTPAVSEVTPPIPVLRVGQPASIDLFGDGQAAVTVTEAKLSAPEEGRERLVVTIDVKLVKAGDPITGGPENYRFRDNTQTMHLAQTSDQVAPPGLKSVSLTVAGQESHGRLYFDVPAGAASGGYVQLMTGNLVHAVWQVQE